MVWEEGMGSGRGAGGLRWGWGWGRGWREGCCRLLYLRNRSGKGEKGGIFFDVWDGLWMYGYGEIDGVLEEWDAGRGMEGKRKRVVFTY